MINCRVINFYKNAITKLKCNHITKKTEAISELIFFKTVAYV